MDENKLELIKAIGSQWKFLLVVFFIIIFLIKWGTIWKFVSSFTQLRVKRGQNEFEIQRKEDAEDNQEKPEIIHKKDKLENDLDPNISELADNNKEESIHILYFKALKEKRFADSNKLMTKIIESIDNPTKAEKEKIYDFYWRHSHGDISAFQEFEEYISKIKNDDELKSLAYSHLTYFYEDASNLEKIYEILDKAINLTNNPVFKASLISRLSYFYYENGDNEKSINLLLSHVNNTKDKTAKSNLYISIASYYKKQENKLFEAIAYQKALESVPNNTNILFKAAFSFCNLKDDQSDLGMVFYRKLLRFDPESDLALNNLGVAYVNQNMNNKSIENYKKSFKLNNSLAASNLASVLIGMGFFSEANDYLEKAKLFDEVDDNVIKVESYLQKEKEKERNIEKKLLERGNLKYKFFNYFGGSVLTLNKITLNDLNSWILNGEHEVSIIETESVLRFSWNEDSKNYSIVCSRNMNSLVGVYSKPQKKQLVFNDKPEYEKKQFDCYGYIKSKREIKIMFEIEKEITIMDFEKN